MDRREFTFGITRFFSAYLLLDAASLTRSFSASVHQDMERWARQLEEICSDLKLEYIPQYLWQEKIGELFEAVPLEDLLNFIDFENLRKGFSFPDLGVATRMVKFPAIEGLERTTFVKKIFGLRKDRAIIPHGHSNMVSSHLILDGKFRLRQYDKIAEENASLLITPTLDIQTIAGNHSSISDAHNNIHWFIAESDNAFTFDVIVLDLNEQSYDIHNLDMEKAVKNGNGELRVPVLDVESALKKYGKNHHG
ncbi:hypothetical protein [Fulvivirga sedimenti]|uniref:Uncharacterized protein n=1 Tax=Fulvivirga sedimenti TaxID=2879465 RepID=A0A9X1HLX4_9BACT|nr:hypothetical protein [Fulvivirga sedimenti]MCA6074301.1 hypothetical protein [Fulvivirga sedimenti]